MQGHVGILKVCYFQTIRRLGLSYRIKIRVRNNESYALFRITNLWNTEM